MNYWITARRGRMGNVQWGIGMCEARACVGARHAVPVRGKGWAMGQWGNGAMGQWGNGAMGQWAMGQWGNGQWGNGAMGHGQWGNGAWAMGNVAWACGMCRGTACLARSNEDK